MNTSNFKDESYLDTLWKNTSTELNDTVSVLYYLPGILVCSIGILTDLMVIILILLNSHLRTTANSILCSSCFCGLMLSIQGLLAIISFLCSTYFFNSNIAECLLHEIIELELFVIFNIHITLINLQRCLSIIFPFKYQRWVTKRNIGLTLLIIWLFPLIIFTLAMQLPTLFKYGNCSYWYLIPSIHDFLVYVLLPVTFILPPLVTTITYCIIIIKIYTLQKKTWMDRNCGLLYRETSSYKLILMNRKVLLQMAAALGAYTVSLFPLFIVLNITVVSPSFHTHIITEITYTIAGTYLIIHPILVVYFTVDLKKEVIRRVQTLRCSNTVVTIFHTIVSMDDHK